MDKQAIETSQYTDYAHHAPVSQRPLSSAEMSSGKRLRCGKKKIGTQSKLTSSIGDLVGSQVGSSVKRQTS